MAQKRRLAENLRQFRIQANMSQRQLAAKSGVSNGYIAVIERGEYGRVSIDRLRALGDTLGVTVSQLMGDTPSEANELILNELAKLRPGNARRKAVMQILGLPDKL